jgi:hypothetical protein
MSDDENLTIEERVERMEKKLQGLERTIDNIVEQANRVLGNLRHRIDELAKDQKTP